ncbi:putative major facilitator superfamily protein [Lyophyllum shimeji]|uniref:Major facilitator superfamily protein n=1 Tax=Lyophyllum shimeji TaxID=47721 RepID=A0A9P3PHM5_LYOSH|nr:putative major facilitator superfamily protein [Lyophyllum shimeji]
MAWHVQMPLGFGNAVVLQTMYIALVASLPPDQMAVGTGFAQLLRGLGKPLPSRETPTARDTDTRRLDNRSLGQVGGLATASALFQSRLDSELHARIHAPDAETHPCRSGTKIIRGLRHSSRLIVDLPPDLQRIARDAYAASLKSVFTLAACASLLAYLLRLPIPDKDLNDHPASANAEADEASSVCGSESGYETDDEAKCGGRTR